MKLFALSPIVALASAIPADLNSLLSNNWPANSHSPDDGVIVAQTLQSLRTLYSNSTTLDNCQKCKATLEIGKAIALTKPDLVPEIFIQWCTENKLASAKNCKTYYSRNTVKSSRTGTDFTNLLQLMDPWSLDGDYLCYYKMSQCDLPKLPKIDLSNWWPEKSESAKVAPTPGNETFNVLHVSDFHIELDYALGSEGNCTTNSMCCTTHTYNINSKPGSIDNSDLKFFDSYFDEDRQFQLGDDLTSEVYNSSVWVPAQEFGNYKCDSPELLINSSLKSIVDYQEKKNIDFDFVIFTGDMIDHDELEHTDYNMTIESQEHIVRDMKKYFNNTPVYSVLGNHDTFPYGQLASKASGHENLYNWNDELNADLWVGAGWIPFKDYNNIKKHYSGFSIETQRGLKVVAINSNTYYQKNYYSYWNMTEDYDQFGTLKFVVDELLESERNGQRVWLMAHIPFVDYDTLPIQAEIYKQIVTRFSPSTIAGIFFGHTHQDQFTVLYANDNKTINNALMNTWISQSVTPLSNYNPGWRYYEVDTKTFSIMNSYNFYTKLNETFSDDGAEPTWEFEYSARESYDPEGKWPKNAPLNATFWATVAEGIKTQEKTAQLFNDYAYRLSPYVPQCSKGKCDDLYCYVSSFNINDYNNCTKDGLINY
jgi:predicted phosphodiesterase